MCRMHYILYRAFVWEIVLTIKILTGEDWSTVCRANGPEALFRQFSLS